MSKSGGVFQIDDARGQCPRGGCAWCSTHPSSDPPHLAGWLRACNIKWSRKLGQMGPVGSTRLIRGDIRKCTMLIGYCPKKAFSSIHYFLSANLYKRQERKVPVVMAHRNSRTQIHLYCLHSWSTTRTQHIF